MAIGVLIVASYLVGAIPFGLLIAKAHGIDIRTVGSGNIGATNVSRALGKKWGYLCFVLDALKGLIPMLAAMVILPAELTITKIWLWLGVGAAAILGHVFPVYLKFKGGKGVATSLGVVLGLWPFYTVVGLITFVIWAVVVKIWRYISLGSVVGAIIFPLLLAAAIYIIPEWQFAVLWPLLVAAVALGVILIIRHKDNIKRLCNGTESKIGSKNTPQQQTQQ
ncbi:MAG: glycerol-3-phosphate 1-O-acyltransferase PlsY [Sedimentisphaerales bacterium]|nr:glycerol-3-phosphate 1-O-acyltransferase PlsY [Sedimentisphaerales bacterium]